MCTVVSSPIVETRHVRMSGGGVMVHRSWPEHAARACEAIRQRRIAESRVLCPDGEWR